MDGYAGEDKYLWRIGVCVMVGKIAKCHLRPWMPKKDPAPRYFDLQVSQVTCIWFGVNKIYANMHINVFSGHTGCGKLLHGMVYSRQNFYFDGHVRYIKSKDITRTALVYLVTRATNLCLPLL